MWAMSDLLVTVEKLEKSENVICPTPFDIFKTTKVQHSCANKKYQTLRNI